MGLRGNGVVAWAICLLLVGCGRGLGPPARDRGNFDTYFRTFETESRRQGRDTFGDNAVAIQFGELETKENGRCEWHLFRGRTILIKKSTWDSLTEDGREALLFHELGHCLLRRDHSTDTVEPPGETSETSTEEIEGAVEKIPKTLMHPHGVSGEIYGKHREYYIDELFNPAQ